MSGAPGTAALYEKLKGHVEREESAASRLRAMCLYFVDDLERLQGSGGWPRPRTAEIRQCFKKALHGPPEIQQWFQEALDGKG